MLLYSYQISPRLAYITAFIGQQLFTHDLELTTNKEEFRNRTGPKINYSNRPISENEFRIDSVALLFEKDIKRQVIECFDVGTSKAFFKTCVGDYPFDIFAASFYLMSRYEEYLEHKTDQFGRYSHVSSLAHKEGFLHLPLINIWIQDLKNRLVEKFPVIKFHANRFSFLATYDIDIAYSYLNKGWLRNTGGFLRSFIKGEGNKLFERAAVLLKTRNDPFDSYEWLNNLHSRYGIKALYFFLVAQKQKHYDKNISPFSGALQQLIRQHSNNYVIGIHPSWQSGDSVEILKRELEQLEKISGRNIKHSRQHYLRVTLPQTYRELVETGIENDYSMGYGTTNGFRASVASSFYWYDLQKEEATSLHLYPFCFMDANAYYQQKLTPSHALEELTSYYKIINEVNGLMIIIWHNHLLGTDKAFKGWGEAYESFITSIKQ